MPGLLRIHPAHHEQRFTLINQEKGFIMTIAKRIATALFTASVAFAVVGCASTSSREGTGEYVDDSVITAKVKASIFNEPTLKSTEINVETFKGDVQLSGFVAQPADAQKAAQIARGVKGVTSVKNDIRVK
jgi:osmotically-inducible protein OsmY